VSEAGSRFRFAQFEFPWELGPDDGRYMLREAGEEEPRRVLALRTLGAAERRRRRRPRKAAVDPPPQPVAVTRVTVIDLAGLSETEADRWLRGMKGDVAIDALEDAMAIVNRALSAHRVASVDPSVVPASRERALVARLGYGRGEEVADGQWSRAVEIGAERRSRVRRRPAAMRPQERFAGLVGGHERALACEELTLRARLDLASDRPREAALQLRVALEAGIVELEEPGQAAGMPDRVEELREQREAVGAAANRALDGVLGDEDLEAVEHALGRLEAALRARAASGPRGRAAP
jgi:hypothetical protein